MKIAHIADIHQGLHYAGPSPSSRFDDINRILDWIADKLIEEKVQIALIAGDCFKDAKVMLDRASQEIASIVRFLRKLSDAEIEAIVISGTPSHDAVAAYDLINEMNIPLVEIHTMPYTNCCYQDPYRPNTVANKALNIALLPGLNRSALMTQDEYKGLPPEQIHRIMTDRITQLCVGMAGQMPDDKPKILVAHMTYQGSDTGFTDLLMQNEPVLIKDAVSGFNLVCLGHIHRPQQIDGKVFYSGPIDRLSFNEEGITPGFYIHEIRDDLPWDNIDSRFIKTPARRYLSLKFEEGSIKGFSQHGIYFFGSSIANDVKDSIVRLYYTCSDEVAKQLNRKTLEKALYDAGCYYVAEIKADIQRVDRARDSEVTEGINPVEALDRWGVKQGIEETERQALTAMTGELLEEVVA